MSLFKRGKTWWVDFTTPAGERIRRTARTRDRTQAQEYHDKLRAEAWRIEKLGERPSYVWDEAAYKFLIETQHKATHDEDKVKLKWLQQFLRGKPLAEVNRDVIASIGERKLQETTPATANRYLALIRAILRKAANDWEWIDRAPFVRLYKEAKRRIRWITPEQAATLLEELPEHQRDVVLFALSTGLRQSNVLRLEWSQIDLVRAVAWIHPDQAKARRAIHVPLNSQAVAVLNRQIGRHPERVFTFRGKPIRWANTRAWREALRRAGIEDFRWHDLRHTWASWLTQHGTPSNVLQELGGWESESMVRRYAHLAPAQLLEHSERLAGLIAGTPSAQQK